MLEFATVKRVVLRGVGALVLVSCLIYGGDYGFLLVRPRKYGTVTIESDYEIHEKNGKTEYEFNPPAPANCVNSLFPHLGYQPCWYLRRHPNQKIDI